ncbi:MAG: HAMP domain-containing sensor histidine kinase [Eubacteriales bacterium]|nr:HAMP domain-containing sensor histidine kinase [Eubacteriales bacterium]
MATKWKNFTRNCWVKAVACLLILVLTGVSAWQIITFYMYASDNKEAAQLMDPMMLFSDELPADYPVSRLSRAAYHLTSLAQLGDENYIKEGKAITTDALAIALYEKFAPEYYDPDGEWAMESFYPDTGEEALENTPSVDDVITNLASTNEYSEDDLYLFRTWLGNNPGVFSICQQEIISAQLQDFKSLRNTVDQFTGIDYYIYDKSTGTTLQNIGVSYPTDAPHVIRLGITYSYLCSLDDNQQLQYTGEGVDPSIREYYGYDFSGEDGDVVLIGMKTTAVTSMAHTWQNAAGHFRQLALVLLLSGVLILLSVIVLICGAGRNLADNQVHLIWFDHIWTEVQAILFGIIILPLLVAVSPSVVQLPTRVLYTLVIGTYVAVAAVWLAVLLSQVRRIKAKQWLNGWILWRLLYKYGGRAVRWLGKCLRGLHRRFRQTPLHRKIILICGLVPLACAFWITIPFIIAGALYFGMRAADRFALVCSGASDIRAGKTDTHIALTGGGKEIQALADDLNGISDGLGEAVSTAVKSERLKSELISNVSHDIKTPLTSIITYIDLLKRCDISDPTAQEYINTLDQKAKRLQTLTLDLFDASKATSGAMQVDLAKTDFDALLRQALGERSDHLEKAGLDVRVQSQPLTYVRADGRLLWRILDNLLSNCARYALPNSRVYIALNPENEKVVLTIKNISAVELNIPADDLMQRFTRGDRSRHTEGSGLGLSIAQSLAELMSGTCQVEIDGDLFKASVAIPKWEEA